MPRKKQQKPEALLLRVIRVAEILAKGEDLRSDNTDKRGDKKKPLPAEKHG
ncbi:MAG: hypothetical protein AAF125_11115 [Chloroflexota bacterium]